MPIPRDPRCSTQTGALRWLDSLFRQPRHNFTLSSATSKAPVVSQLEAVRWWLSIGLAGIPEIASLPMVSCRAALRTCCEALMVDQSQAGINVVRGGRFGRLDWPERAMHCRQQEARPLVQPKRESRGGTANYVATAGSIGIHGPGDQCPAPGCDHERYADLNQHLFPG
jgi:hypothetical protein